MIIGKENICFFIVPPSGGTSVFKYVEKADDAASKDSAFNLEVKSYSKPSDKIIRRNPAKVGNKQCHDNSGIKPLIVIHFFFQNGDCRGAGYEEHHYHKKGRG